MRCADCVYYRMDSDGVWYCSANFNDPGKPCINHVLDRGTTKGGFKRSYDENGIARKGRKHGNKT